MSLGSEAHAATVGPYSFALASSGHEVTLVDLSAGLLSLARTRATLNASQNLPCPVRIVEGDALFLDKLFPDETGVFDAVLLLGPLYHIMSSALREDAIREAWAMVKPGGVLICAWVSRWAHYRDVATRDPTRLALKRELYDKHTADGYGFFLSGLTTVIDA